MIVDLDKATVVVLSGGKVQLHFQDASTHMRSYKNRAELSEILDSWEMQTKTLRSGRAQRPVVSSQLA